MSKMKDIAIVAATILGISAAVGVVTKGAKITKSAKTSKVITKVGNYPFLEKADHPNALTPIRAVDSANTAKGAVEAYNYTSQLTDDEATFEGQVLESGLTAAEELELQELEKEFGPYKPN